MQELPAPIKQIISTELQREILRRQHAVAASHATETSPTKSGTPSKSGSSFPIGAPSPLRSSLPPAASQQSATAAAIAAAAGPKTAADVAARLSTSARAPTERKDLFGRPIVDKKKRERAATKEAEASSGAPVIRFKYHEGVTDAVRRTVRIRDLL